MREEPKQRVEALRPRGPVQRREAVTVAQVHRNPGVKLQLSGA